MATWKKVIVSGSTAELANLKNAGIAEHAAVIGGGSANDQTGVALTNGQLLIGADGAAPTAASLTTATATESGSLKIDAGANSLKLRVAGDTITALSLSGSVLDTPTEGQTVKVGPNGTFTFDDASSVLSAGDGITITKNEISASVDNSTLEINGSSQLQVKDTGITTSKLADSTNESTGVTFAKMQHAPANTIVVRDANSSGDLSAKAVSDGQIVIGDGNGFTAAKLSGEATMTNGGVVSLANNIGGANTRVTGSINQIQTAAGTDTTAFVTFVGDAESETNPVLTSTGLTANMTRNSISATEFTGSLKGDVQGNADTATSAGSADALATNATGTNLTLAGNLIVNGITTEVRTTNLNIEDKIITLGSGSATNASSQVNIESGFVFAGARLGAGTVNAATNNSGSAIFIDKSSQRLTVTTDAIASNAAAIGMDTNRAHIPLVFTGSFVDSTAGQSIGNFKVDSNGEFYVYTK